MHNLSRGNVWIATLVILIVLAGCGGTMDDNTHGLPVNPDAPVSGVPGQSSGGGIGSAVSGRVVDAAGRPIVGVVVMPQSNDSPPHPIPEIAVLTNDAGQYQWSLPPGRYTFTVHREGQVLATSVPVTVVQGQTTTLDIPVQQ